jgi:hypothetical protein
MAARRRPAVPVGPSTTSGRVRRVNWPSRTRNGSPPKWSPCRWLSTTASTSPGSTCCAFIAVRLVAPQSTSAVYPSPCSQIQVWNRPPLPNASPLPTNLISTAPLSQLPGSGCERFAHQLVDRRDHRGETRFRDRDSGRQVRGDCVRLRPTARRASRGVTPTSGCRRGRRAGRLARRRSLGHSARRSRSARRARRRAR